MKEAIKKIIRKSPLLEGLLRRVRSGAARSRRAGVPFPGSSEYWESRYSTGGDSGVGSYGQFAEFKADVLNEFVAAQRVQSVIEFGCGDGNQLSLADYPSYVGFDVSGTAIHKCKERFKKDPHKSFRLMSEYQGEVAELALSLDVIYHLVEEAVFEDYMRTLFAGASRFVIVYSSDRDDDAGHDGVHVKHRRFTLWIERNLGGWKLKAHVPNRYPYRGDYLVGSFADFYVYERA